MKARRLRVKMCCALAFVIVLALVKLSSTVCLLGIGTSCSTTTPANTRASDQITPYAAKLFSAAIASLGADYVFDGDSNSTQGPLVRSALRSMPPSLEDAHLYMRFAGAAYCSEALVKWNCPWCLPDYTYLTSSTTPTTNTKVFFAKGDASKKLIVGFRGTYNFANVLQDLTLVKTTTAVQNVRVHRGFRIALEPLLPFVREKLRELTHVYPDYTVVIMGHSLGAAMAALAYFELSITNEFPSTLFEVYAYGQPRVGNQAWADYMNRQPIIMARINNRADLVPHIPPAVLGSGSQMYFHQQHEIWIEDVTRQDGIARYCSDDFYEDPKCSDSLGPLYSPLDHLMYYDVNLIECGEIDPVYFLVQTLVPLNLTGAPAEALLDISPNLRVLSKIFREIQQPLG